ncbi:hypothetical protein A8C32_09495 [Flavivirga aquatica]|uniref:Uncharacterized protein n=1 Tax=Flavivirga aquatica TaxID=1849968 RepID=A0A1E5SJT2_9FLAO|nr:hypothetical protein [Flavivirga aquatica]OEJ99384.1 hypothetical protein A8C32_09495 [Flavivirga aquatica]
MTSHEFKTRYLHTLQTDPKTKQNYIKLPITDLSELIYMQESLLENIVLLTQLEKRHYKSEQLQSAIYWLCKILLISYPNTELDGLSEWLKP